MSFPLQEHMNASDPLGFTGNRLIRDSENRSDDCVQMALAEPGTRIFVTHAGRLYMISDGTGLTGLHAIEKAEALGARLDHAVLLGQRDGSFLMAAPSRLEPDKLGDDIKAIDYRSLYIQQLLSGEDEAALGYGAALLSWHGSNRFCGRCGERSQMGGGGVKRTCPSCKSEIFPRTDPVAIMLAVREDQCLMGRSPHFPPGMYSCLAGFIEPGESLEEAVRRETLEESGVHIGQVRYHASQPWPFPHSLMIGCYGEALSTDIDMDRMELEDCRWFSQTDVRVMLGQSTGEQDSLTLPPKRAIAHRLIADWAASE